MRAILLLILLFQLTGCLDGTDTGNPGQTSGDNLTSPINNDGGGKLPPLSSFVDAICTKLSSCEGSTIINCDADVYAQTNIDNEIGLTPGDFTDLNEVEDGIKTSTITLNTTARDQCILDINSLTCGNPAVTAAYDDMASNPFEGVAAMLPVSCQSLF